MGGHLRTSVLTCAHHSPARTPELWGIHRLPETHPFTMALHLLSSPANENQPHPFSALLASKYLKTTMSPCSKGAFSRFKILYSFTCGSDVIPEHPCPRSHPGSGKG